MPNFVDKEFDLAQANMTDIRAIVHALKMANLAFVEDEVATEIKQLIKNLPSAEKINEFANSPEGLKDVRETVGYIMSLIDAYGQRDVESKARYKSKTRIPPRYKVLEWRSEMNTKSEFVKELVKISSVADDKGNGKVAEGLIRFAKVVKDDSVDTSNTKEVIDILKEAGYVDEANMVKEALFEGLKTKFKSKWQAGWVGELRGRIAQALKRFEETYDTKVLNSELSGLEGWISKVDDMLDPVQQRSAQEFIALIQRMKSESEGLNRDLIERMKVFLDSNNAALESVVSGAGVPEDAPEGTGTGADTDTDGDGIPDATDPDADGDGAPDTSTAVPTTPPDISSLDTSTIDKILTYLRAGDVGNKQYKEAMSLSLPEGLAPEIVSYIESIKSNPELVSQFAEMLRKKQTELSGAPATATPATPATATPATATPATAPTGGASDGYPLTNEQMAKSIQEWVPEAKFDPANREQMISVMESNMGTALLQKMKAGLVSSSKFNLKRFSSKK